MVAVSSPLAGGRMSVLAMLVAAVVASFVMPATASENNNLIDQIMGSTLRSSKVAAQSPGERPGGAFATSYDLSKGSLFAWQSKTPHQESDSEVVAIVLHGVDRNAGDYFKSINDAYRSARDAGLPDAPENTLRVAPLFFASPDDDKYLNGSTLAWSNDNDWSVGYGSRHPSNSDLSSFSALDDLVDRFSSRVQFPKVRKIIIVGHGGGAMLASRYAAVRRDGNPSGVSLRFVIGNPSSMLYFTNDRYKSISNRACSYFNTWFFGLEDYDSPYSLGKAATALFAAFVKRDVRYIVSLDDTSSKNGDQSCGARAQGGAPRKTRTLSYWKYIHLLAGANYDDYSSFPGTFASLKGSNTNVDQFKVSGAKVSHQLFQVNGIGHDDYAVLTSSKGQKACFA